MKHYLVISPEMEEIIPVLDDGSGPLEYGCCVVSVAANTIREAKIKAVRHPGMQEWVQGQRENDLNPFAGLTTEIPMCKHGVCFCDMCQGKCPECEKEWEKEWERK